MTDIKELRTKYQKDLETLQTRHGQFTKAVAELEASIYKLTGALAALNDVEKDVTSEAEPKKEGKTK